ncbi:hypothetical protein F5Y15DRAFT_338521 [Xylariaceae sp. FL0016]|nr:hypothetical protein F5Y15DRAFT_338521 [Xylariaceae sp. FL0016]
MRVKCQPFLQFNLFSAFLVASSKALASAFTSPTQTEDGAVWGPRQPLPTPPPRFASAELLKRDFTLGHDTCGFGSANTDVTYRCYSSVGTCEDIGSYRGCCTGGLESCSSTFWTECEDYTASGSCGQSVHTRCCSTAAPYCITWLFSTSGSTVTAWDCDDQSDTRTFELLATPLSLITSTDPSSSQTSTSAATTITLPANSDKSASSSNSGDHVGAIVGGVVGGVAVVGLIILGILFLRKYHGKKSNQAPNPPQATAPPMAGPAELPGASSYPPTNSYYAPVPQHDAHEAHKYQSVAAQPAIAEAPSAPATGTASNRAELR